MNREQQPRAIKFVIYVLFWAMIIGPLSLLWIFEQQVYTDRQMLPQERSKTPSKASVTQLKVLESIREFKQGHIAINGQNISVVSFVWPGSVRAFRDTLKSSVKGSDFRINEQKLGNGFYWGLFGGDQNKCHGLCLLSEDPSDLRSENIASGYFISMLPIDELNMGLVLSMESLLDQVKNRKPPKKPIELLGLNLKPNLEFGIYLPEVYSETTQGVCDANLETCHKTLSQTLAHRGFRILKKSDKSSFEAKESVWHRDRSSVYIRLVRSNDPDKTVLGIQQSGPGKS